MAPANLGQFTSAPIQPQQESYVDGYNVIISVRVRMTSPEGLCAPGLLGAMKSLLKTGPQPTLAHSPASASRSEECGLELTPNYVDLLHQVAHMWCSIKVTTKEHFLTLFNLPEAVTL